MDPEFHCCHDPVMSELIIAVKKFNAKKKKIYWNRKYIFDDITLFD